ncbi:carboxypeptidase-like regulatory domain-containing protein [Mucilaginibacter lappiensis]|uniref:carboxypeptidase-like regulatory domain-containing protein n=1 Tax=Mucilaginibacter lappiensis TaxID=354630 RepID=UPI003D1B7EE9
MGCLRGYILSAMMLIALPVICRAAATESILAKNISVHVNNMRLGTVLKTIEQKGNFTFSYNSNIVKTDSLVTVNADNWTIKEVLDHMLMNRFEYKETHNFVILRYAPLQLSLTTEKAAAEDDEYSISGFVTDEQSGKRLENASVYDRVLLQSTLTDKDGHFELHLKNNGQPVTLTISKEFYKDTTITFLAGVTVNPNTGKSKSLIDYVISGDSDGIENTSLGRLFISTKQQIQAANLHGLIAQAPFQASAIPGVSTHAEFSGQVVNTVSLNAVGGYNAGVDGFELGLIFNLDKGDVGAVQIAGIFNVVGGNVNGIQLGGLYNNVLGSVRGIQLSLLHNSVKRDLNGIQLSGLYNHTRGAVRGIQLGALGNIAGQKFSGIQLAGLFNYARNLRGVQLGLVNFADTSSGYSIGLINIVRYGYHKLALSANETLDANVALKTGSKNFYTIWRGGMRFNDNSKLYGFGFGFGRELGLGKRLALNPELTQQYIYQGNWTRTNQLSRIDAGLTYKFGKNFSINAGPSLNIFYSDQRSQVNGYAYVRDLHHSFINDSKAWSGWVGWSVGISFF